MEFLLLLILLELMGVGPKFRHTIKRNRLKIRLLIAIGYAALYAARGYWL